MRKLNIHPHLRRILAATLAIIMAMSLAIPAFAVEYDTCDPGCPVCNPGNVNTRMSIADAVAAAVSFPDVDASLAAYDAIMYCAAHSIINGYSDGTFRPVNTLSRSNFTVLLSRAFFADDVAKYNTPNYLANGQFYPNYVAMSQAGALDNTSFENFISSNMNVGISRYDMAQLVTNIMNKYGYAASSSEKNAVISGIPDYSEIPSQYKDAVLNVYSLGIIGGYTGGYFSGNNTVTRQVGAIVMYRMLAKCDMLEDDEQTTPDPEAPVDPSTGEMACACVRLYGECKCCNTTGTTGSGSGNTGTGTGTGSGTTTPSTPEEKPETPVTPTGRTLSNGKAITEANVNEILSQLKTKYPTPTSFANGYGGLGTGRNANNNCLRQVTSTYATILGVNLSTTTGCGGWAAFIADEIFSQTGVTWKKTTMTNIRPGDLLVYLDDTGRLSHVSICTGPASGYPTTTKVNITSASSGKNGYVGSWTGCWTNTGSYDVWTAYPD